MTLRPAIQRHLFAAGVGLISLATLGFELMLTRIFSVTLHYHFAFMVISVALLGLAIAGVTLYLLPRLFDVRAAARYAAVLSLLFALSSLWALRVAADNPIDVKSWRTSVGAFVSVYLGAVAPFLCSGMALSLAIASARERIGQVYAFDLVGAALGCVFVVVALPAFGGPGAIVANAGIAAAAALAFSLSNTPVRRFDRIAAAVGAVCCIGFFALGASESDAQRLGAVRNPYKAMGKRNVEFERWNAFSQVAVSREHGHRWITIDGGAATRIWPASVKNGGYEAARRDSEVRVASLAYALRNQGTALIIGPGGGTDIISALHYGVPRVVGVEVNPIIVNAIMLDAYADFSGNLYSDPRVSIAADEGRSYVRRSKEKYSSIQATLVDTWAASAAGAYTLSENNLYTLEAFDEFIDKLEPNGILTVTRWYAPQAREEFLRLCAIARAALERRGVSPEHVRRHFAVAHDAGRRGTMLVSRGPFSRDDIDRLATFAHANRLRLLYAPVAVSGPQAPTRSGTNSRFQDAYLTRFLEAPDAAQFVSELSFDARPPTDDRPFFFFRRRPSDLPKAFMNLFFEDEKNPNIGFAFILAVLTLTCVLTLVFVLAPMLLLRGRALRGGRVQLRVLGYFLCLGLAFILVEVGFMQKFVLFLGHPIYALAVVLATLLLASGLGSALSSFGARRWGVQAFVRRTIAVLALILLVYAVGLQPFFHALIGIPFVARVAIAVILVFIPGLLMGTLLPSGVRTANAVSEDVVAWAWGLNGATSVVGSVLAVLLSMNGGFTVALGVGIAVYLLGMLILPKVEQAAPAQAAGAAAQ